MKERDVVNIACNLAYRLMWQPVISAAGEGILTPDIIREACLPVALPENAAALTAYDWPGNMRELSTMIKRFVLLGDDIFAELRSACGNASDGVEWGRFLSPIRDMEDILARNLILKELQPTFVRHLVSSLGGWNQIKPTKLAEALGCSYNTLMSYRESPKTAGNESAHIMK